MLKFLFAVHLCVVFVSCQMIRAPSNTALLVGQRLELMCQPDVNYLVRYWKSKPPSNMNKETVIFSNWKSPMIIGGQPFGYIKENNSVTLYLNSTQLENVSYYECSVQQDGRQFHRYGAQLIVLQTEPICQDNMSRTSNSSLTEGSIVWIRCILNFRGNLAPTMEWRQQGISGELDDRIITETIETIVIPDNNITSTLTMVINSTYNTSFISCRTYFQRDITTSPNSTMATNAPDYSYTWNSSIIIVPSITISNEETATVADFTSGNVVISPKTETSLAFSATYMYPVAGIAIVFGIASSLVAVILCLRLRRKNSVDLEDIPRTEVIPSEYELMPYACTAAYETIGEVDEKDDITRFNILPPRLGPLPRPDFAGNATVGVGGEPLNTNEYETVLNLSQFSDGKEFCTKPSLPTHHYIDSRTLESRDIADDSEEIPSAYLKLSDTPFLFVTSPATDEHSIRTPTSCNSPYLTLLTVVDQEGAVENEEMPSTYQLAKDEDFQPSSVNNTKEPALADDSSTTYLMPRK